MNSRPQLHKIFAHLGSMYMTRLWPRVFAQLHMGYPCGAVADSAGLATAAAATERSEGCTSGYKCSLAGQVGAAQRFNRCAVPVQPLRHCMLLWLWRLLVKPTRCVTC